MKIVRSFISLYFLIGLSFILSFIAVGLTVSYTVITNEGIVLTFIGMLATIIVMGNVAQVIQIESNYRKKMNEINESISKLEKKLLLLDEKGVRDNEIYRINLAKFEQLEFENTKTIIDLYRLYSINANDKGLIGASTLFLLKTLSLYYKIEDPNLVLNNHSLLFTLIIGNLEKEKWNNVTEFDYQKAIEIVHSFHDSPFKPNILEKLVNYSVQKN